MRSFERGLLGSVLLAPSAGLTGTAASSGSTTPAGGTAPDPATGAAKAQKNESDGDRIARLERDLAAEKRKNADLDKLRAASDHAVDTANDRLEDRKRTLDEREQAILEREQAIADAPTPAAAGPSPIPERGEYVENTAVRVLEPSYIDNALRAPGDVLPRYTGEVGRNLEVGRINNRDRFIPRDAENDDD